MLVLFLYNGGNGGLGLLAHGIVVGVIVAV